jgi:2-haloacid dehalogenase
VALVLFDLNGTLLDPGPLKATLQQAVRLAMAHTLAGDVRPFAELIEAAGGEVPQAMPAFHDVAPGLDRLRARGHRLAVVTQSARATGEQHLSGAGILDRFERVLGTDAVGAAKPDRRVYAHALQTLGAEAGDTWFVAAHDWDVIGAHGAGLRTVFVDRGGPPPVSVHADRIVRALTDLDL